MKQKQNQLNTVYEPENFLGGWPPNGSPEIAKIDIIAVGNDNKIFIHFK